MPRRNLLLFIMMFKAMSVFAVEPDILVKHNGDTFKVFNLDVSSSDNIYYTLTEDINAPSYRVKKNDILIIKKANGDVLEFYKTTDYNAIESNISQISNSSQLNVSICNAIEPNFVDVTMEKYKQGDLHYKVELPQRVEKQILAKDNYGNILNFRLIDAPNKLLAVTRPRPTTIQKKNKFQYQYSDYKYEKISIPEYILIGKERYTVTEIDPYTFCRVLIYIPQKSPKAYLKEIVFPSTLQSIGIGAFAKCRLNKIILPKSIQNVGTGAFHNAGSDTFSEISIPKSIKEIGQAAFLDIGKHTSFWGYYKGYLSSMPDFITTGNCTSYGIDEEAVEDYLQKH